MYHCTIYITFTVQQKMLAQYIREKIVTKKEMLDTVDITPEHLEEILLCFTGQGSQKLSFCQSVLETYQQQFSAGVEYALTSARCLSFVDPKPRSARKTLHTLIKRRNDSDLVYRHHAM